MAVALIMATTPVPVASPGSGYDFYTTRYNPSIDYPVFPTPDQCSAISAFT